jgi:hypothetical protein
MDIAFLLSVFLGTAVLAFLTHLLARRLTKDVIRLEEKHPGLLARCGRLVSKWFAIVAVFYFGCVYLPAYLPPRWVQRQFQRRQVAERVASTGGWEALIRQSSALVATNTSPPLGFIVPWARTNLVLPPAIAALQPHYIHVDTWGGSTTLRFHVFGIHSTGHRDGAFYSVIVLLDGHATNAFEVVRARIRGQESFRRITDGVFEVYH